jgi:hypothetical protein
MLALLSKDQYSQQKYRKRGEKMGKTDKEACVEEREMANSKNCHV